MATSPQPSRVLRGLRTSLVVLLVALGLAELGLRLFGPDNEPPPLRFRFANRLDGNITDYEGLFQPSDSLFWELRPGGRFESELVNAQGMRGPELLSEDEGAVARIAVLGDSCTFGIGVALDETYGAQLEGLLVDARPDQRIQVLNAGVPGYSVLQGLRAFEQRVLPLAPDGVVLYFGAWNDFNPAMGSGQSDLELGRGETPASGGEEIYDLLRHSRLFELCALRYAGTLRYRHWRATVDAWLAGEPPNGYRVPLADFEALFAELLDRCVELDLPVVVVLPELNEERRAQEPIHWPRLDAYRTALRTAAEQRGIAVVDLRVLFADTPHAELFVDMVHPAPEGHRRLARALAERIEQEDWLE